MSFVSDLLSWLKKFVKKVVRSVVKFVKKYWAVLLIVALIFFAPQIALWLTAIGAPAWLVTAMGAVATHATPVLTSIWGGAAAVAAVAATAFGNAHVLIQAAIVLGAIGLVDEEALEEIVEIGSELVGEAISVVASGVAGGLSTGLFGSPHALPLMLAAGLAYWLFFAGKSEDDQEPRLALSTDAEIDDNA